MTEGRGLWAAALLLTSGLVGLACANAGEGRVLSIDATGVVDGVAYVDLNGTRTFDAADNPLAGVRVRLLVPGTRTQIAEATSGTNGVFRFGTVVVGSYSVQVDTSTVPDSVQVVRVDTSSFDLIPSDSVAVAVALSFPIVPVSEARTLPLNQKVFIEGVALNARGTFSDTTVHVVDSSGAIRATQVKPVTVSAGDSVRILGRLSSRLGQRTITDVTTFLLGIGTVPLAETLTTGVAATADGGRLDAALVKVLLAPVTDTMTTPEGTVLTLDDGSGPLEVLLDSNTGISPAPYVPTTKLDVVGLLAPTSGGSWRLKPRARADLTIR